MKRYNKENVNPFLTKKANTSKSDTVLTSSSTSSRVEDDASDPTLKASNNKMMSEDERKAYERLIELEKLIANARMEAADLNRQADEHYASAERAKKEAAEFRAETAILRARNANARARAAKAQLEIDELEEQLRLAKEDEQEMESIAEPSTETNDDDESYLTVDFRSAIAYCDETIFRDLKIPTTDPTAKWKRLWGHRDFKDHRERLEKLDAFENSDDSGSTFASLVKSSCENEDYTSLYLRGCYVLVPNYLSPDERAVIREICEFMPINNILEDDCPKPQ